MASKAIYSVVAVIGIVAASGAAWWYMGKPLLPKEIGSAPGASAAASAAAPASAARAAGVEVARAQRATLQDDAQSVGSLRSLQSVMLRPEVPGRVLALGFSDGAMVRKGQVLVQLDDTLQRAEIRQAQAQVSIALSNYKRNQELVAQNFVAQRVLEESSASLQVAEAQLALSCARWSRMAIVAPFDGTVGIRNINPGDFVKDGADLINLEDIGSMYVDFRLPERYQSKLQLGQKVELQLDAFPGRIFKASVQAVDPLLDVNGRSVGVRAVLPNTMGEVMVQAGRASQAGGAASSARAGVRPMAGARPARSGSASTAVASAAPLASTAGESVGCPAPMLAASLPSASRLPSVASASSRGAAAGARGAGAAAPLRPGMFARVTTVFAVKEAAVLIPEEAIVPQGGRQFVIKVVEPAAVAGVDASALPPDTKFVSLRQEVRLGARQFGRVEVVDGLLEGETVVLAGQQRLQRDGSPLRIVELGRPQAPSSAPAGAAASGAAAPASVASR
ncbi:MAG: efflux RND transporter periplasmic adaptor subunit [Burkholderiaceae bacterium]